jgi:hypothetical protein
MKPSKRRNKKSKKKLSFLALSGGIAVFFLGLSFLLKQRGEPEQRIFQSEPLSQVPLEKKHCQVFYLLTGEGVLTSSLVEIPSGLEPVEEIKQILKKLFLSPSVPGLISPFPPSTELRAVFIKDSQVYLDFFLESLDKFPKSSFGERVAIGALGYTIFTNFPEIKLYQILLDGEPHQSFLGHISLARPFSLKDVQKLIKLERRE